MPPLLHIPRVFVPDQPFEDDVPPVQFRGTGTRLAAAEGVFSGFAPVVPLDQPIIDRSVGGVVNKQNIPQGGGGPVIYQVRAPETATFHPPDKSRDAERVTYNVPILPKFVDTKSLVDWPAKTNCHCYWCTYSFTRHVVLSFVVCRISSLTGSSLHSQPPDPFGDSSAVRRHLCGSEAVLLFQLLRCLRT